MEDEEFDEEEFTKAMDMYEEAEQEEAPELIDQNELDDILNDHIKDIKSREDNIFNKNKDGDEEEGEYKIWEDDAYFEEDIDKK